LAFLLETRARIMGRRGRWGRSPEEEAKNPDVKCPFCGSMIRKNGLKKHQKGDPCNAKRNAHAVRKRGLFRLSEQWQRGLVKVLQLPVERLLHGYDKRAYREAYKETDDFVPQWVGAFLSCCERTHVSEYSPETADPEEPFRSYGYVHCAKALHVVSLDSELQDAVVSVLLASCGSGGGSSALDESIDTLVTSLVTQAEQDGVALPIEVEQYALREDTACVRRHCESLKRKQRNTEGTVKLREEARKLKEHNARLAVITAQAEEDERSMERDREWGQEP
jgi:hypothetical protein